MSRKRLVARALTVVTALAALAVPSALAQGGGPGGGGGGGGNACAPLAMTVKLAHADGNGNSAISVLATLRNCTSALEPVQLTVSVPGSGTVPFRFSTGAGALQPGGSLTMNASPIGSTPLLLHFGQTYDVVGTLTEAGATPATLATVTTQVTMPTGVVS